jgi:hypothetical protein
LPKEKEKRRRSIKEMRVLMGFPGFQFSGIGFKIGFLQELMASALLASF